MPNDKSYRALVDTVVPNGRHGAYAVARTDELGLVTFSLSREVWQEEHVPVRGDYVILGRVVSHITKGRATWRAKQARAVNPSDPKINQQDK